MKKPDPRRGKKSEKAPPKAPARTAGRSRCRALAVVDEQPWRDEAVAECERLEGLLTKARAKIEAFETGDLPAFQRWEASVLGPWLTEVRTLEEQIAEKDRLLEAIDDEILWSECDPVTAYGKVMKRLQEGRPLDGSDEEEPAGSGGDDEEDLGEEELDPEGGSNLFPPGFRPEDYDGMSTAKKREFREYYRSLAELYEMITGMEAPSFEEMLAQERARLGGAAHRETHSPPPGAHGAPPRSLTRDAKRIKELYRSLVRQLHPDSNRKLTAREKELWHQVQEAYRAQDLERMEALAGRVEMGAKGGSKNVPVQFLRRMAKDLTEALRGLRKQLDAARKHEAWNFRARSADLSKLEVKRRRAIQEKVRELRGRLGEMEMELKELAALADRSAARSARRPGKKKRPAGGDSHQGTFSF